MDRFLKRTLLITGIVACFAVIGFIGLYVIENVTELAEKEQQESLEVAAQNEAASLKAQIQKQLDTKYAEVKNLKKQINTLQAEIDTKKIKTEDLKRAAEKGDVSEYASLSERPLDYLRERLNILEKDRQYFVDKYGSKVTTTYMNYMMYAISLKETEELEKQLAVLKADCEAVEAEIKRLENSLK